MQSCTLSFSEEPSDSSSNPTGTQQEELDPIQKLKKAYAEQKRPLVRPEPAQPHDETPPTFASRLFSLAQTYATDVATDYGMGYAVTTFINQKPANHKALLKSACINALRIPSILDAIYRIPFKVGLYADDSDDQTSEEFKIARMFVEDAVVDYAVNYTYRAGIFREQVDHTRLIKGALVSACRFPFIADCIIRLALI